MDRKGDQYVFLGEIANLTGEKSDAPKFTIIKSYGKTYSEAREALNIKHTKPIFLGTTDVLILTTALVEYGMEEYMYRVRNVHEYRKTIKVVTTRDDAEELLGIQQDKEASSGALIEAMLTHLTKSGKSIHISASEVIEWLTSDNNCYVLPNIDMNENKDGFVLSGYTIVHKSVYTGFIPAEESKGLIILLNKDAAMILTVPLEGKDVTVETKLKKQKINAKYKENKLSFDIEIEFESVVKYLNDDTSYTEEDNDQVNSNLEKILHDEVQYTINQAQRQFKCDYLGLNHIFRIKYPNEYRVLNWPNEFVNAEININVKNELDPGGEFDYNAEIFKEKED